MELNMGNERKEGFLPGNCDIKTPPIRVSHTALERYCKDSPYRSKCPSCTKGVLLITRDPQTFSLCNVDFCIGCGRMVIYMDTSIAGEPLLDVTRFLDIPGDSSAQVT